MLCTMFVYIYIVHDVVYVIIYVVCIDVRYTFILTLLEGFASSFMWLIMLCRYEQLEKAKSKGWAPR